jgi:hypothetical protein
MTTKNTQANEELRQRNKDSFQNAALYWNQLSNERLFEISKQLLGIAFIILPLTGSIVLSDKTISTLDSKLLILGWISLFTSIISGFYNFWEEAKYFNYLSNDSSTREAIWSDTNVNTEEMNRKTEKLGKTRPNSSFMPLLVQGAALFLGVFLIMIVVYNLIFQNGTKSFNSKHRNYRFYFQKNESHY